MNPKIRTWHKQLKEFVPPFKHNVIDKDGNISPTEFVENTMFSGHLDRMDKEVFEGDKIKALYCGRHQYEGIVVFDNGSFSIKITKTPQYIVDYDTDSTPELNNFDLIEITGNIYQE